MRRYARFRTSSTFYKIRKTPTEVILLQELHAETMAGKYKIQGIYFDIS